MELQAKQRKRKFDVVIREFGDEPQTPVATRAFSIYGVEDKSIEEIFLHIKKKLGLED